MTTEKQLNGSIENTDLKKIRPWRFFFQLLNIWLVYYHLMRLHPIIDNGYSEHHQNIFIIYLLFLILISIQFLFICLPKKYFHKIKKYSLFKFLDTAGDISLVFFIIGCFIAYVYQCLFIDIIWIGDFYLNLNIVPLGIISSTTKAFFYFIPLIIIIVSINDKDYTETY